MTWPLNQRRSQTNVSVSWTTTPELRLQQPTAINQSINNRYLISFIEIEESTKNKTERGLQWEENFAHI